MAGGKTMTPGGPDAEEQFSEHEIIAILNAMATRSYLVVDLIALAAQQTPTDVQLP